jgi:ParB/RepB/Spo0J family partition protein
MASIAIQELKHDRVEPDPHNPRQVCEEGPLLELGTDIAVRGILQPIVVRKHPTKPGHFMIVFGERRWRAAGMVDCATVPAIVREYAGELQVLEDQIAENGKRADVHPLEEADAYRRLHEEHGRDVEEIADLTGKSKAYVYAAMKLCALTAEPRRAFLAGKFDKSIALLIARLPGQQQPQATKQILAGRWGGEVMSYRDARDYIQRDFMLELGRAPFNINDATLVPAAGTCGDCPKRTGNQQELFADVCSEKAGDNRCTDPACFKSKSDAHWKRLKETFKSEGKVVLEGQAAAEAGSYRDKKFADINDYCQEAGKSYKALLGRKAGEAIAAIAKTDTGAVRELVDRKRLPELLKAAGVKTKREASSGLSEKDKARRASLELEEEIRDQTADRARAQLLDKLSAPPADEAKLLRLIARMVARSNYGPKPILERRGVKADNPELGDQGLLLQTIDKMTEVSELRVLIVELLVHQGDDYLDVEGIEPTGKKADYNYRAEEMSNLTDALEVYGINARAIAKLTEKDLVAAAAAKEADRAEKTSTPKKPQDAELTIPHKPGCELERFVFTAAGAGVDYHPRKGGPMSTGAGFFDVRKCPKCDSGVTTPALPAKAKKQTNGAPAAEATS